MRGCGKKILLARTAKSAYLTKLELRSQSRELIVLADRIDPLTIGSVL